MTVPRVSPRGPDEDATPTEPARAASMIRATRPAPRLRVSVGVCAFDEASRIRGLLESDLVQPFPGPFLIQEVLVVAIGCSDGTDGIVRDVAAWDPRVVLIHEPERRGKASALNRILSRYRGDLLVLLNADARPTPRALAPLLMPFAAEPGLRIASGAAVPEPGHGLAYLVERVLWDLHNRVLSVQSLRGLDNHCCDELMAVRRGFVDSLPDGLVNDGAYLGVLAALSGQSVRFCGEARVGVRTPASVRGLLARRRRILRGHRQIRRMLDRSPNTLEHLGTRNPGLAARIVGRAIRDHPSALPVLLLLAVPLEILSLTLAA